jgi:dolichol-phosphate mannosyltransferase
MNAAVTNRGLALVIDACEWFTDPAWAQHVSPRHWRRLPQRAGVAVRAVLLVLAEHGVHATFFVPGELVRSRPELLAEVVAAGHEVGLLVLAGAAACAADREDLERATGCAVRGVRIVGSASRRSLAELAALGFAYDASSGADEDTFEVIAGDGARATACAFAAWRLDAEQPRLMGLPRRVRQAHEELVTGGPAALVALCPRAAVPLAAALGLGPPPAVASSPPRAPDVAPHRVASGAPRLSIVVPLKDEQDGIASLFVELDQLAASLADVADCDFVLVDDGSTDTTWSLLEQHAAERSRVRLVRHEHNRGVAAAIRTGMLATDSALVASIDGDLSYDPMELRAMLPLIESADVVTASPYDARGGVRNVPGWRLFLSKTLSGCYRVLLRSSVRTWTSCFRIYRRAAVAELPLECEGFLGTAELLVRVLRRGGRVAEHPCVLEARLLGFSKLRVARTVLGHVGLLWRVLWRRVG